MVAKKEKTPIPPLFFFKLKRKKLKKSGREAEAVNEKRDHTGHPTADRPNPLPYYPRLWSSGTGVLSRDSTLSQKATEVAI